MSLDSSDQLRAYDESQHPRDERGRWTDVGGSAEGGAGFEFFSPNVEDIKHVNSAQSQLRGERQKALRQASAEIDRQLGMFAKDGNSIGAWKDGAENGLITYTSGESATWDRLKVSGAMKGYLADQKAVLIFHDDKQSSSVLYNFDTGGVLPVEEIHKNLLEDGLAFHTIVPHSGGGATVYIADLDGSLHDAVAKASGRYNADVEYRFGRAEFIGTASDQGSDREQRDDARRAYEEIIKQSPVQASQTIWGRVHRRWGETLNPDNDSFVHEANGPANEKLVEYANSEPKNDVRPYLSDMTSEVGRENIIGYITPDGTVLNADETHEHSAEAAGTDLTTVLGEGGARVYLMPGDYVGVQIFQRPSQQQFNVIKRVVARGKLTHLHIEDHAWKTIENDAGKFITPRDALNLINQIYPVTPNVRVTGMPREFDPWDRKFDVALASSRTIMRQFDLSDDEIDTVFEEQTKTWDDDCIWVKALSTGHVVLQKLGLSDDVVDAVIDQQDKAWKSKAGHGGPSPHTDWMNDCVPEMMGRGKEQDQAIAICLHMFDDWSDENPGRDEPGYDGPQRPPAPEHITPSEDPPPEKAFDPSQPRDEHGRWTDGGGSDDEGGSANLSDEVAPRLRDEQETFFSDYEQHDSFPHFNSSNNVVLGVATKRYNCAAYAMGDKTRWWWPGGYGYFPEQADVGNEIKSFDILFGHFKGERVPQPYWNEVEKGRTKIALFVDEDDVPTHLARLDPKDGKWVSKIGAQPLVKHEDISEVTGGVYGRVERVYSLPNAQWAKIRKLDK